MLRWEVKKKRFNIGCLNRTRKLTMCPIYLEVQMKQFRWVAGHVYFQLVYYICNHYYSYLVARWIR